MRKLMFTFAALGSVCPLASAQLPKSPTIPLQQNSVPVMNPLGGRVVVTQSQQMGLASGVGNTAGSMVYVPPRYINYPGTNYVINNSNNGSQNPFGYPAGGFTGYNASPVVQFNAIMGGSALPNPFSSNAVPLPQTWSNTTGVGPNGRPWGMPAGFGPGAMMPQYPQLVNAPQVVGQANGFFPNQPPPVAQPANPNNFGIQVIPGLNAPK